MTDVGMTGDYDSIVGMHKDEPLRRFMTGIRSAPFAPATTEATMCGVAVETDEVMVAVRLAPVRLGGTNQAFPDFW